MRDNAKNDIIPGSFGSAIYRRGPNFWDIRVDTIMQKLSDWFCTFKGVLRAL